MPRTQAAAQIVYPGLEASLQRLNIDELKWYLKVLPEANPARKAEQVALLYRVLIDPARLKPLLARLAPLERQVVAEVAYSQPHSFELDMLEARYPGARTPRSLYYSGYGYFSYGGKREDATPYDLFFFSGYDYGRYMATEVAATVRMLLPAPAPSALASQADPPAQLSSRQQGAPPPALFISDSERAIFHDLSATLYLIQQGKATIGAATRLPTLPTLRLLRATLLHGDYFHEEDYDRAEDAVRPLALVVLVQAAKWAAPTSAGTKLELTKAGQALLGATLGPQHIREAWERWLKSDLLDELSRVRNIKGQQAKGTRLTKPAERRAALAAVLPELPPGRWVEMDELLRYLRATRRLPAVERSGTRALSVGSASSYYSEDSYSGNYWDVVIGSYLRATLWEYVATLGLIEIAYTWPEEAPHDFGQLYYLDDNALSRYDGLVAMRLSNLGAYVLGLASDYTPPPLLVDAGAPVLKVLPNLDVVITAPDRITPGERTLIERIAAPQSQDVYRLSRELLLEASSSGLDLAQVKAFLAGKSGQSAEEFPQIVRVFFDDMGRRLGALREGGSHWLLEADDPLLLTELSNNSALRALVELATVGGRTALLIPSEHEATVRRQLKKLGYLPRKQ